MTREVDALALRAATADEIPDEQALFRESWSILKKYRHITRADPGPWDELVADLDRLSLIGKGGPCGRLSASIGAAIAGYLVEVSRGGACNTPDHER